MSCIIHSWQCKQLVSEDLLPLTLDQAVSLAALQLHVEVRLRLVACMDRGKWREARVDRRRSKRVEKALGITKLCFWLEHPMQTLLDPSLEQGFFEGGGKSKKDSRILLTHLKHALPAWCFRLKNVGRKWVLTRGKKETRKRKMKREWGRKGERENNWNLVWVETYHCSG